jgi:hypothetical protein
LELEKVRGIKSIVGSQLRIQFRTQEDGDQKHSWQTENSIWNFREGKKRDHNYSRPAENLIRSFLEKNMRGIKSIVVRKLVKIQFGT